jgi:hypothetical protein
VYLTFRDTGIFSGDSGFFIGANFVRNNDSEIAEYEVFGTLIHIFKFVNLS